MSTCHRATIRRSRFTVALLGALLLAGCKEESGTNGGSNAATSGKSAATLLKDAGKAIADEQWKAALTSLDAVIADPKATAQEKSSAWEDKVICEGRANGEEAAIAAVKKLAAAKAELTASQFAKIAGDLRDVNQLNAALAVIEVGTEKFKGDPNAKKLFKRFAKSLAERLQSSNNTEGIDKLKSLGYLGGDDDEDGAPADTKVPAPKNEK